MKSRRKLRKSRDIIHEKTYFIYYLVDNYELYFYKTPDGHEIFTDRSGIRPEPVSEKRIKKIRDEYPHLEIIVVEKSYDGVRDYRPIKVNI